MTSALATALTLDVLDLRRVWPVDRFSICPHIRVQFDRFGGSTPMRRARIIYRFIFNKYDWIPKICPHQWCNGNIPAFHREKLKVRVFTLLTSSNNVINP